MLPMSASQPSAHTLKKDACATRPVEHCFGQSDEGFGMCSDTATPGCEGVGRRIASPMPAPAAVPASLWTAPVWMLQPQIGSQRFELRRGRHTGLELGGADARASGWFQVKEGYRRRVARSCSAFWNNSAGFIYFLCATNQGHTHWKAMYAPPVIRFNCKLTGS